MALPCWLSETASLLAGDLVDTSERDASEPKRFVNLQNFAFSQ